MKKRSFEGEAVKFTAQETVPIQAVYEDYGLIKTEPGHYCKSYRIGDNNFLTLPDDEQYIDYKQWKRLLNTITPDMEFMVTINNRTIDTAAWAEGVLIKETGDRHDYLRKQMNDIIRSRILDGKNGIIREKYLTVSVHADSVKKAAEAFQRLDGQISSMMEKMSSSAPVIPLAERMDILYGLYNGYEAHLMQRTRTVDPVSGRVTEGTSFDFTNMRVQGLRANDLIAPGEIEICRDHLKFDGRYVRTLRVTGYSIKLRADFLERVTEMGFHLLLSFYIKPISSKDGEAMIARNLSFVRDQKTRAIRAGQKAGIYDDTAIDPKIAEREAEALAMRDAIHEQDEHLFATTLTATVFADSLEELNAHTEEVIAEFQAAGGVRLNVMAEQQEAGFNATLPLCCNQIRERRTMTSSAVGILIPFSTVEINDPGGINYSCNAISRNLIVYDRMQAANFNGFILGTPGSGKSFAAKVEMLSVFLKTNADIIVIDPEDEYGPLCKLLGGEVIKIVPGGDVHINPLEIVSDYEMEDEMNQVNAKADFMLKLMETIVRSPFGLGSVQETIIDECVHELFEPFFSTAVESGKQAPRESSGACLRSEIPEEEMPTLTDLQQMLTMRPEPEARELAMALKLYTGNGSQNTFGFATNKRTTARFVVYQIRDIGDKMKPLTMLVILDHIWNRIVQNRKIGKNTYFYIDEIYLLFQEEYSATFLNTLFRRARKYGGVPTGITQNVSPLLESQTARDMLQNCNFIEILKQAGPDQDRLREILNLSDTQLEYITNSPKGQGLLYTGKSIVPFYSRFPKDNDIYRCLTSDMKEIKDYEEEEKRAVRLGNGTAK